MDNKNITKKCCKCKEIKPLSEFHKNKRNKDEHRYNCKNCVAKYTHNRRIANLEKAREKERQWYLVNSEKAKEKQRRWKKSNPEKVKEMNKKYYLANSEKERERCKQYCIMNPTRRSETNRRSYEKHCNTLGGRLNNNMASAINQALRGKKAGRHWESLVGYTADQLRERLEKQFTPEMTWELFLQGKIHIDHKIPIAIFNFEKPEDLDFKRCWALGNLQPLWATDNCKKHTKIDKPFQPSLIF